jgi:hypothetical protein
MPLRVLLIVVLAFPRSWRVRRAAVRIAPFRRAVEACATFAPLATATRARFDGRRSPRTIRCVKASAFLSASVQNR